MNLKTATNKILHDIDIIDFISSNINNNLSVIYFSNKPNTEIHKLSEYSDNLIFVSKTSMPFQCFSIKHINNNIVKHLSSEIIIAIDINDNVSFNYMKYLINNLIHLFEIIEMMLEYKTLKEMNDKQFEIMIWEIKKEVDYNLVNGEI